MLLSALDPALLFYKPEDWSARESHCRYRFDALVLHRRICSEYRLRVAISNQMVALVWQHFPYGVDKRCPEARDLRIVIDQILQMVHCVDTPRSPLRIVLKPVGVVGQYLRLNEVKDAWNAILAGLGTRQTADEFRPQIATWGSEQLTKDTPYLMLEISDRVHDEVTSRKLPLVWDEDSWFAQLETLELWDIDNLSQCVEIHFRANPSFAQLPGVRAEPMPFGLSPAFKRELAGYCAADKDLQRAFIEALAKLVHRILDPGLGDEVIQSRRRGGERRFRITCAGHPPFRAHYRIADGVILLNRFGPHKIDGID